MRRITTTIALLGLSLFALLTPSPASAASTIEVTSATLVAKGVALDITLTVTCPAGMSGGTELIIRQRSGNTVAYASGWAPLSCAGEPRTATGRAWVSEGGRVLHNGEALIGGNAEVCGDNGCDYANFEQTIRITR
ncbi:hypothetical protein F4558_000986 [Micromonospora profundi]|uniref:hypothetical protein n=1 Tax=Micromonospora profundi TaxID=1420889 RepID=UPI00143AEBD3|nr:hypothetical protein [Micromonospora profundi]NJC11160.1 hypothetical protein [Micromonospora profundi]